MYAFDNSEPTEVISTETRREVKPLPRRSQAVNKALHSIQEAHDATVALIATEVDRIELVVSLLRVAMTAQQIVNMAMTAQNDLAEEEGEEV